MDMLLSSNSRRTLCVYAVMLKYSNPRPLQVHNDRLNADEVILSEDRRLTSALQVCLP
jgi:hypothetical protein